MKREYYLLLIIFLLILIYILVPKDKLEPKKETSEKRAVFISYIELGNNLRSKNETDMKNTIDMMLDNVKTFGFNMIILQVRSFSDAIYESDIYPSSRSIVNTEGDDLPFDILDYFIKEAHKNKLELHAWINPYRISNNTDISIISKDNPAYELLNTNAVKVIDNVKFLDLDYDVDKWSNTILESARIDRKNTRDEMKKAGFDIKCESKKLEKFYLGK